MTLVNDAHQNEYGAKPDIVVKSPGRFHLIGEHSWFFKDKTLSMAVNMPVYVSVSRRHDTSLRFYFSQIDERKKSGLASLKFKREDRWANALKSVIYGFVSAGFPLMGMDIMVYSDILPSAGFGITTAMKVALAVAVKSLFLLPLSDADLLQILECGNRRFLRAENLLADNITALFAQKGSLLVTDYFKSRWDYIPYMFEDKRLFLVDTKVPRVSVWNEHSLYEPENALILGDLREPRQNVYGGWRYVDSVSDINEELSVVSEDVRRKLLAIMREHGDVLDAREGLEKQDFFKFARAVNHSHETMRDMFNISCPEIDWLLKRVSELEPNLDFVRNPVTCGRITGKGYGRCLYAFLRESDEEAFGERIAEFEKIFGFHPLVHKVETADGAGVVRD